MSTSVQIAFDCEDPHAQARFWAAALGYRVEQDPGQVQAMLDAGFAQEADTLVVDGVLSWRDGAAASHPEGQGPRLYFQRVPEAKGAKNRVHLDLHVGPGERDAEVARLEGLGARVLYEGKQGPYAWITMADPEGNELCVA